MQKTKEEEFLKLFDRWKEEEKEKLVDEMEKVKEMFMKEFKELTSKNSALEYVSIKPRSPHSIERIVAFRGGVSVAVWHLDPQVPLSCPGPDSHPPWESRELGHIEDRASPSERNSGPKPQADHLAHLGQIREGPSCLIP